MILEKLAQSTRLRVEQKKKEVSLENIRRQAESLAQKERETQGGFAFPFRRALEAPGLSFICEVKKASPSKGLIAPDFPWLQIAKDYEAAGASAISVLTEPEYFLGSDRYLQEIARTVALPVLRKDFTVDAYQIYEAKTLGASAVLLIVSLLSDRELKEFLELAHSLGLSALTEAHDEGEVRRALAAGAGIVGVNNRDLKTFSVDVNNSRRLRSLIPPGVIYVSESGIRTAEDVEFLYHNGTDAVLIGETLMRSPDKTAMLGKLKQACRPKVKICGLTRPCDVAFVNRSRPDYAGFVFARKKRRLDKEQARALRALLDPGIVPVGVFVNEDPALIAAYFCEGIFDMVQLHGQEDEAYLARLRKLVSCPVIQAFGITGEADIERAQKSSADFILLDNGPGGTGQRFDWSFLRSVGRPFFLAGGLDCTNAAEAAQSGAYALDVSSGVETDGKKDAEKIEEFIRLARLG